MSKSCCKCVKKVLEILCYLVAGYFCGGCANSGTCILKANIFNGEIPCESTVDTNLVQTIEK